VGFFDLNRYEAIDPPQLSDEFRRKLRSTAITSHGFDRVMAPAFIANDVVAGSDELTARRFGPFFHDC